MDMEELEQAVREVHRWKERVRKAEYEEAVDRQKLNASREQLATDSGYLYDAEKKLSEVLYRMTGWRREQEPDEWEHYGEDL